MKIVYAFYCGMLVCGMYSISLKFNGADGADPEIILGGYGLTFVAGFIIGLYLYNAKMRKKAEEEERQAEQDRINDLMHEYLEKKLREEENGN